ncbi:hypothetical protein HDU98_002090 [Podochytrium sp. JEL0797]|nr:hypothetical protein HDU98_002090 [Podochytrium sp. JEL0797]
MDPKDTAVAFRAIHRMSYLQLTAENEAVPDLKQLAERQVQPQIFEFTVDEDRLRETITPPPFPEPLRFDPAWHTNPPMLDLFFGESHGFQTLNPLEPLTPTDDPAYDTDSDLEMHSHTLFPEVFQNKKRAVRATPVAYICQICHTSLTTISHHSRHMRSHYGVKPYTCKLDTCNRRFSRKDNMLQHYASHFRERKSKGGRKYKIEKEDSGAWEYEGGLESAGKKVAVEFWSKVANEAPIVNGQCFGRQSAK